METRTLVSSTLQFKIVDFLNDCLIGNLIHPNSNMATLLLLNGFVNINLNSISIIPDLFEEYLENERLI